MLPPFTATIIPPMAVKRFELGEAAVPLQMMALMYSETLECVCHSDEEGRGRFLLDDTQDSLHFCGDVPMALENAWQNADGVG